MNAPYDSRPINTTRPQGFSLIEVLIAIVILSIGLLGLAALQTVSLRTGHDSYLRTQATMLAYDIVDRMRANPAGLAAANYDTVGVGMTTASVNCVTSTAACTASQLAEYDIRFWKQTLESKLAQGKGTIATTTGIRTITVMWSENDLPMELVLVVQL